MLSVTYLLPIAFLALVWWSYRHDRRRAGTAEAFRPEGKIRWQAGDAE